MGVHRKIFIKIKKYKNFINKNKNKKILSKIRAKKQLFFPKNIKRVPLHGQKRPRALKNQNLNATQRRLAIYNHKIIDIKCI